MVVIAIIISGIVRIQLQRASFGLSQADVGSSGGLSPYYRKPSQYVAIAVALAGKDVWDVEAKIQKPFEAKERRKVGRYCD